MLFAGGEEWLDVRRRLSLTSSKSIEVNERFDFLLRRVYGDWSFDGVCAVP